MPFPALFDLSNIYLLTHPHLYMGEMEGRHRETQSSANTPSVFVGLNISTLNSDSEVDRGPMCRRGVTR